MARELEVTPLDPCLNSQLLSDFKGKKDGLVRVRKEGWLLPARYADQAHGYRNMPLRQDDVWVATFPRSGTTWCQEMVWLINHNYAYETARKIPLFTRFPFYEFGMIHHPELHKDILKLNNNRAEVDEVLQTWRTPGYLLAEDAPSPRHFKTHLPFSLLPPSLLDQCKVIYVARNPLDVVVSYYHQNRYLAAFGYTGDFEKYWKYFRDDLLMYSPYWDHIKQAWKNRKNPNFLFLFYEDLFKDLPKNICLVSEFLGKNITEEQVTKLANHLQIDNFRNNVVIRSDVEIAGLTYEHEQGFIRKGKVKGNSEFSEELEAEANKWIAENLLSLDLIDFKFPSI